MNSIVIAFPKREIAENIKKILAQSGYYVTAVCTTGAQILSHIQEIDAGILVCGYRFVDMTYEELYTYLPGNVQMLLIASAANVMEKQVPNLVCLALPLKVHELLETVEMMDYSVTRMRKQLKKKPRERSGREREILDEAKRLLMERNHMTEEEAHRYIQKRSMDNGIGMVETAQMVLSLMGDG